MNTKYLLLFSAVISTILSAAFSIIPVWIYNQWEVSSLYPTLFTPNNYTFSIWSVIYLSWIALWLHEAFGKSWVSKKNVYLLATAQIISSIWLIPSQYLYIFTSLIVMTIVLVLLSVLVIKSLKENIYFKVTSQLFFGWILVAFIANIHLTLVVYNLYTSPEIFTYISIILALAINLFLIAKYSLYIPAAVLIWSAIWIISGQKDIITQILSWIAISSVLIMYIRDYFKYKKY